jgi:cobalt-precorrin 5A hydrolase
MTLRKPKDPVEATLVAGLGCRSGVPVEMLHLAIGEALAISGRWWDEIALLAAPDFKERANFDLLAERMGLVLVLVRRADLEAVQGRCLVQSAVTERLVGLAAVAEAAALAVAGPGARLLGPHTSRGGATCALAQRTAP